MLARASRRGGRPNCPPGARRALLTTSVFSINVCHSAHGGSGVNPASAGAGMDAEAAEGVMLKRRDAVYVPGRPKGP